MEKIETRSSFDIQVAVESRSSGGSVLTGSFPYGVLGRRNKDELILPYAFKDSLESNPIHFFDSHDITKHIATTLDKSLEVSESRSGLKFKANLDKAINMANRGISVGFTVRNGFLSDREGKAVRVISQADLHEISIVDDPAYPQTTINTRQLEASWISGGVLFGQRIDCECQGGACDSVIFEDSAFDSTINSSRELIAVGGEGYASPLGSRSRGSLVMEKTRTGLLVGLTRESDNAKVVRANAQVAPVYIRPIIDPDLSEYQDQGQVRRFSDAHVRAFLVKGTPNATGLEPAEVRSNKRVGYWL